MSGILDADLLNQVLDDINLVGQARQVS